MFLFILMLMDIESFLIETISNIAALNILGNFVFMEYFLKLFLTWSKLPSVHFDKLIFTFDYIPKLGINLMSISIVCHGLHENNMMEHSLFSYITMCKWCPVSMCVHIHVGTCV